MNYSRNIFKVFTEEKLTEIRNHPYFKVAREKTIEKADEMLVTEPPRVRFSQIHLYATTGNRSEFETVYFHYCNRMNHLFMAYLFTEDEKYLPELADTIWNICDFETWTLPAHVKETYDIAYRRKFIALFSSRTGRDIATILYYIGDRLPELVTRRAKAEVQYRIIDSFADREHAFAKVKHNWAAVCIEAVLGAYLYLATDEEIEKQIPRMMEAADNYLSGYQDDCCCQEGISYWNYGFSHFLNFAAMLKDYTNGKINYFENPKVKKIAMFPYRIALDAAGNCLTFADSSTSVAKMATWMGHMLRAQYPDFPISENEPLDTAILFPYQIFWCNPDYVGEKIKIDNAVFENVQQFVYHGNNYAVGAKAGHNNEFHNHNDVGSFIVSKDNEVAILDLGAGKYTKQYFAPDSRYLNLVCSSRGHSVPIINGREQEFGNRGICQLRKMSDSRFTFDMKYPYDVPSLESLVRDIDCHDDYFMLTDTYEFSEDPTSLVERFVSREPFIVEGGAVKTGNVTITYDADALDAVTSSAEVECRRTSTLHFVDFTPKNLGRNMSFAFKFM